MNRQPTQRPEKAHFSKKKFFLSALLLLIVATYVLAALIRPFNELAPNVTKDDLSITTSPSSLPWPDYGQSAFGLSDGTIIATHGEQTPIATASAAKIVTALCVLQKRPLALGAQGPTITLNANDVALYNNYVAVHGSVVGVSSGEQVSERQALEAMLLPSANNIADSLAIWAFGSVSNYIAYANSYLKDKGLSSSHIGSDASGFAPDSTSTASDLVRLGALAVQNATLAQIVNEPSAVFPGVGTIRNVNSLLGSNGIVGIKTGNSDQDGGVFVGAARVTVNGKVVTVISAIADAGSLGQALSSSASLLAAGRSTIASTTVIHAGDVLGTYQQTDGTEIQAIAQNDINLLLVRGSTVAGKVHLQHINYDTVAGKVVGTVTFPATELDGSANTPVVLKQGAHKPGLLYRLLHP